MGFAPGQFCVFCGLAIGADEETVGRGSATAHATCADSALADDVHWDRIAEQSGEADASAPESGEPGDRPASPGRAGCLAFSVLLVALTLSLVTASIG